MILQNIHEWKFQEFFRNDEALNLNNLWKVYKNNFLFSDALCIIISG